MQKVYERQILLVSNESISQPPPGEAAYSKSNIAPQAKKQQEEIKSVDEKASPDFVSIN
jgi:hypothetical protein